MAFKYCALMLLLSQHNSPDIEIWQKQETIVIWILSAVGFISIILFMLIRFFYFNMKKNYENKMQTQQLKASHILQLQVATMESIENERKRLAADLHDGILSQLSIISMQIQLDKNKDKIIDEITSCITSARKISHDLYPPMLLEKTLDEIVYDYIQQWEHIFKIQYFMDVRHKEDFSQDKKLHLLRSLQEIIMNAYKHANSQQININLKMTQTYSFLSIEDNGIGINTSTNTGIGLKSINNRIELIQGNIKTKNRSGLCYLILLKNGNN